MPKYLVVANQTLGGEQLMTEIARRAAGDGNSFYVVVPLASIRAPATTPVALGEGYAPAGLDVERREEEARHRAELTTRSRLETLLTQIRALGAEAEGEVGDPDPVNAVARVLRDRQFDEILVSTLPTGISRWLRRDVPSRIERASKLPVVTVTAKA